MSIRDIVIWPDPRLSTRCDEVEDLSAAAVLVADLLDTMYAAGGRGLAAPQVGVLDRIFVMDASWKEGAVSPVACINPRLLSLSDERVPGPEACLSIPGVSATVERARRVRLEYRQMDGALVAREFDGFEAIIAQHEFDHLDGLVHFDRLAPEAARLLIADYEALP